MSEDLHVNIDTRLTGWFGCRQEHRTIHSTVCDMNIEGVFNRGNCTHRLVRCGLTTATSRPLVGRRDRSSCRSQHDEGEEGLGEHG